MSMTDAMLRELAVLSRMPEGNVVTGVVRYRREAALERLLNATGEEVYRLQGQVRALDELLKDIREAPQRLHRSSGSVTTQARQASSIRNPS
jgi:uncharacterized protein YlxW (UPF0749 family)